MARNLPNGRRVYVKPKIGGKVRPIRMKSGTASFLGLKVAEIEKGKRNSILRGAVGTKSFTVYLRKRANVGGAAVVSLAVPVPGDVKVLDFYKWAKAIGKLAGMRTPNGVSYYWANAANGGTGGGGGDGGFPLPGGGDLGVDDIGDLIDAFNDIRGGQPIIPSLIEAAAEILD
jgi:hypothetical protein